jgi:drug/metabolite transporter (DMT)-like permease
MQWLPYALLTVCFWGLYGVLLHTGQEHMGGASARYKAYLWVGVAYFLAAVIMPALIMKATGSNWHFPPKGVIWSLIAGTAGAIGAFGVLLAFGAQGRPPAVMAIVFAGAPIVNAVVSLIVHPPEGGWGAIRWPFFLGIVLAATGAAMVMKFKPPPAKHPPAPAAQAASAAPAESRK